MQNARTNQKVGEIELFRAIFCLIIMLRHAGYLLGTLDIPFGGGALGVEFFFLVSGYLMMAGIQKRLDTPTTHLANETIQFVGKKISGFYPEMVVAYIIGFVFESVALGLDFDGVVRLFAKNPFEVLLLRMAGFGSNSINGVVWYLQSMILCMLILYPLIRKYPDMMKKIVMPLTAFLLLGWLSRNYGDLRDPNLWIGFTFKGNVRAMAELCLGAVIYPIVQWLKTFRFNTFFRVGLTVVKWSCWLLLFAYMWRENTRYDFLFCFVFAVAVTLAFSQQCIDTKLYQNRFVYWLGKMSLPYFLSHIFFAQDLPYLLPEDMSDGMMMVCYFACTIACTIVVTFAAKGIRKLIPVIKEKILQK